VDAARVETLDSEIDRIIERRARERKDADRVEELWRESARKVDERWREEMRALWHGYHMDQAQRIERTAAQLAAEHRARAEELVQIPDQEGGT
jgi:hypothetical protein